LRLAKQQAELDEFVALKGQRAQEADLRNRLIIEQGRNLRGANLLAEGQRDSLIGTSGEDLRGKRLANDSSATDVRLKKDLYDTSLGLGKLELDKAKGALALTGANARLIGSQAEDVPKSRVTEDTKNRLIGLQHQNEHDYQIKSLGLARDKNKMEHDALMLDKRSRAFEATGAGSTALEKGTIASLLGQEDLAKGFHPSFQSTPEQLAALKSAGISYTPDGAVDNTQLLQRASGLRPYVDKDNYLSNSNESPQLQGYMSDLERLSTLYGDDPSKVPGLSSIVPTDVDHIGGKVLSKRLGKGEAGSPLLEFLYKKRK
jgi:hypothetical protein